MRKKKIKNYTQTTFRTSTYYKQKVKAYQKKYDISVATLMNTLIDQLEDISHE